MSANRDREEEIFDAARELAAHERAAYLAERCGQDADLRQRIEGMLEADAAAGEFFNTHAPSPTVVLADASLSPSIEKAGDRIGRYKLLQQIGEGGCGVVYMAEQEEPVRRRVALKVIKLGMDTRQVIARFEAERQALALMDHPNIARVLDAGATETGRPYFVMELVRGTKITEFCDQKELPTQERLDLFLQVCSAVQHAHQKGIIHRDIKPSNILVTVVDAVPVPKVIDFGIAKATNNQPLTDKTVFTAFEQFIGTPAYMSPEQAELSGVDIDTRTDIYSLGVVLYELLTGGPPFDQKVLLAAGLDEMRRIIRETEPPRPSNRLSTMAAAALTTTAHHRHTEPPRLVHVVRGDLDWIAMKCLEKDRARRYETANALAADIRRHLDCEPVVARPPSRWYEFQKTVRRHKFGFAATAALILVLAVGVLTSTWQAVRATNAEKRSAAALDELRATAPAFAEQARALVAREHFAEAIEKLDYALRLRPDAAEFLVAKGDLLRCQLKLAEAAAIYREALRAQPGLARAEASAKLCDELLAAPLNAEGKLTRESLAKLHLAMQQQQRPAAELMPVARLLGEEKRLIVEYWLARLKDLPVSTGKPLEQRLTVRDDGRLALDLRLTKVHDLSPLAEAPLAALDVSQCEELTDLSPLRGIALIEINLSGTSVADLTPLSEMHTLEKLNAAGSKVSDLAALGALRLNDLDLSGTRTFDISALRGMKLKKLSLRNTRVADLSSLAGMPLTWFDASTIPAADYSPLAGAPLETCTIQHSPVQDLSFLRDSPVRDLCLFGCNELRGYSVLAGLKGLELLILPQSFRSLQDEELAAIGALRAHPTLRNIQTEYRSGGGWVIPTTQSKDIFWQDWDREQSIILQLRKSGIKFTFQKLGDSTWYLNLDNSGIQNLTVLSNAPVSRLSMSHTPVSDLTPLRGTALKQLWLFDTKVTDLNPLQGMPTEVLNLGGTKVSDITALRGMPLTFLRLHGCTQLTNLSPLRDMKTLSTLTLPPNAKDFEFLRALPNLKRLSFTETKSIDPSQTTEEFWKEYDTKGWLRVLRDRGITIEEPKREPDGTWSVRCTDTKFADLSVFRGVPISKLDVTDTSVADLSPARDLPLKSLTLFGTKVSDLRPLSGLALEKLDVRSTLVTDLTPLRSPPLSSTIKELLLWKTKVTDFSPVAACTNLEFFDAAGTALDRLDVLRGHKLHTLMIARTKVTDLSVLAGMPLKKVDLEGTPITDLGPLLQCQTLKSLVLPPNARDITALRKLPALVALSYESARFGESKQSAAEFWKEYDRGAQLRALQDEYGGLTAEAVSSLAKESDRNPGDSLLAMKVAALQVWFGQNADHAARCKRQIEAAERKADTGSVRERAAKNWCLRPSDDVAMLQRVLALAREAARTELAVPHRPWYQQTLGMAEFRAANDEAAEAAFLRAEKAAETGDWHPDLRPFILGPSRFFRAMMLFRKGKTEEASRLFQKAEAPMPPIPENAAHILPVKVTQDQLLYWLTYKEAKAMLAQPDGAQKAK